MPASDSAGFAVQSISPFEYFKTQMGVIIHYLWLSVWPSPLCLDYYGWPKARSLGSILPAAIILAGLGGATVWALLKKRPVAFAGVWFFLILGITSSIVPYSDLVFEHRMYLPLASIVALIVLGAYALGTSVLQQRSAVIEGRPGLPRRIALSLITLVVVLLGFVTARRNVDYRSAIVMWSDVVTKRPDNARAHNNLGILFAERGALDTAAGEYSEALRIEPDFFEAHSNLGLALALEGRIEEGKAQVVEALRLGPSYAGAHLNLGRILAMQGQFEEAVREYSLAVQIAPDLTEAYLQKGLALEREGRLSDAKQQYKVGLQLRPDWPGLRDHIAELP